MGKKSKNKSKALKKENKKHENNEQNEIEKAKQELRKFYNQYSFNKDVQKLFPKEFIESL